MSNRSASERYGIKNSEWAKIRIQVIHRDGDKCLHCWRRKSLQVHHKHPYHKGGSNELDNLATLCEPCHREWEIIESTSINISFEQWLDVPPLISFVSLFMFPDAWPENVSAKEFYDTLKVTSQVMRVRRMNRHQSDEVK